MKTLKFVLVCSLMFFISVISAQTKHLRGTVFDESGEPIIGASVLLKGTTMSTVTSIDGDFSLNVPEDGIDVEQGTLEKVVSINELKNIKVNDKYNYKTHIPYAEIWLQVNVDDGICTFAYSVDGKSFIKFAETFKARQGKWIGAKTGLFIMNSNEKTSRSWVDVDWFRIDKQKYFYDKDEN